MKLGFNTYYPDAYNIQHRKATNPVLPAMKFDTVSFKGLSDDDYLISLKNMKKINSDEPRFSSYEIKCILKSYQKNKDLTKELINMRGNNNRFRFNGFDIGVIIKSVRKDKKFTLGLINAKNPDNKYRFDAAEILHLIHSADLNPKLVKKLLDMKVLNEENKPVFNHNAGSIGYIVNEDENGNTLAEKLADMSIDKQGEKYALLTPENIENVIDTSYEDKALVEKLINNKEYNVLLQCLTPAEIDYFNNEKLFQTFTSNLIPGATKAYFDRKAGTDIKQFVTERDNITRKVDYKTDWKAGKFSFEVLAKETVEKKENKSLVRRDYPDGRYLIEEILYTPGEDKKYDYNIQSGHRKTLFDSNGVQMHSETIIPSDMKTGEYSINQYERALNTSMNKKEIGSVKIYGSKSQGTKIIKNLVSPDGTVTNHTIIQGPKGSKMEYKITDKEGKVLFHQERQHRKIDENHYISRLNENKYDIQFEPDKISVSKIDKNGKTTSHTKIYSSLYDPELINLLKKIPGDYFFKINELGISKIKIAPNKKYNASYVLFQNNYCMNDNNYISMSKELKDNPFVFAHELGHAIDLMQGNGLRNNYSLHRIFLDELEEYRKVSSDAEGNSINYFTQEPINESIGEIIAETNALTSGFTNDFTDIMLRGIILQQNFPKTMAYIAKYL